MGYPESALEYSVTAAIRQARADAEEKLGMNSDEWLEGYIAGLNTALRLIEDRRNGHGRS